VHDLGLGEGQRNVHKTGEALAQRVIPALDMRGLSGLFAHSCMPLLGVDRSIDVQKVGEALAQAILQWNGLPQPLARLFAPIPNGRGDQKNTLEFLLSPTRDAEAAKRFFSKTLGASRTATPRVITVDKNATYPKALNELKAEGSAFDGCELTSASSTSTIL
jgi:DDE domain